MGEYASRLLKDCRVQLESIISRPITLCPPSISANSTTGEAILFGVCLTGLQGLRNLLGWEPSQATAGATAAAEVTVAGAASIHLPRDGADVGAAANTVAAAGGGSRIFERGGVSSAEDTRIEVPQAPRGMERGGVCPSPEFFFKFLVLK